MTNDYLAKRYGKTKGKARNQRILWTAVGSLLLVVFFVWAILINFAAPATLTATVQNFTVVSPQQTKVTITVASAPVRHGICVIKVLDSAFAIVGYKEVTISPTSGENLAETVNTVSTGVSATVDRCWLK
jgi:hypothetical protein